MNDIDECKEAFQEPVNILREWSAAIEAYTGLYLCAQISYILDDPRYCKEGYVILGLKFIEP